MGLLLSVVISYAGIHEAIEMMNHIMSGMVPESEPDFSDLVEYYTRLLHKSANPSTPVDWIKEYGQGYLCLIEDKEGKLASATVKYYDGQPSSTAILFSTKISSFGQESQDSNSSQANGDYKTERYPSTTTTKTIITNSLDSFTVSGRTRSPTPSPSELEDPWARYGMSSNRNSEQRTFSKSPSRESETGQITVNKVSQYTIDKSPSNENVYEATKPNKTTTIDTNISDQIPSSGNTFEHDDGDAMSEKSDAREKLQWHYRPLNLSPVRNPTTTLPEINFQSSDADRGDGYSDDFLRSLDGIKYRPLVRNDPSGRRKSYKKRHSSSSTSSRESRASREEELKMFTSLEESEFESMNKTVPSGGFGSSPNLATRSYSRSRSRENSKERRNETWSVDGSVDSTTQDDTTKPRLKDLSKLGSFEEEKEEPKESTEVTQEEEEIDDFWGSSDD